MIVQDLFNSLQSILPFGVSVLFAIPMIASFALCVWKHNNKKVQYLGSACYLVSTFGFAPAFYKIFLGTM